MHRGIAGFSLLLGFVALASPAWAAGDLQVATGSVDITAPVGYPMGGYGARKGVSQGIHDPLLAKVLLIKSNGREFGIVTYDLVLFISNKVAKEAHETLGIDPVLQIASHTHSGPIPKDLRAMEKDPWYQDVENKVLGALKEAQAHYQPASFSVLESSVYLGHNRRKVNEDGTVTMFWRNADRMPTSPVDPRVGILRFTGSDGHVLALLVNYACHGVNLGPDNLDFSADWPGYMYRKLEHELGAPAMVYFIPGAGGDINPYDDKQPRAQDAFGVAQKTGETLDATVMKALAAKTASTDDFNVKISAVTYDFKDRFRPEQHVPTRAVRILINNNVGILAIPAEPFVRHQMNLRDQSPLAHTLMFGYAYAGEGVFTGYIPTIEAAMQGGYGANYATRVEVGAGEHLVDDAVIWFYEQQGKLRDVPDTRP